jgi:hypothetical protein
MRVDPDDASIGVLPKESGVLVCCIVVREAEGERERRVGKTYSSVPEIVPIAYFPQCSSVIFLNHTKKETKTKNERTH